MQPEWDERRGGPRLSLTLPVTLHLEESEYEGQTLNLSCRGFLLLTEELLPPGTRFSVEMKLPETEETLRADCEVVWVSEEIFMHSRLYKGMGVRLLGFRYLAQPADSSF